jgi:Zn-finger protein
MPGEIIYYEILNADKDFICQQDNCQVKIKKGNFYFYVNTGYRVKLCCDCFSIWCDEQIKSLKDKVLELIDLKNKAQQIKEKYGLV